MFSHDSFVEVIEVETFQATDDINYEEATVLQACDLEGNVTGLFSDSQIFDDLHIETNDIEELSNRSTDQNISSGREQNNVSTQDTGTEIVDRIPDQENNCSEEQPTATDSLPEDDHCNSAEPSRHLHGMNQDKRNKRLREQGRSYYGWSRPPNNKPTRNVRRNERSMGPPCQSGVCLKSALRHCNDFPESHRKKLFKDFWSDLSWDQKKVYITSLIRSCPTSRKTTSEPESRRQTSLRYFLPPTSGTTNLQVCKRMFLNTFGLKDAMVLQWIKKATNGMSVSETNVVERRRLLQRPQNAVTRNEHLLEFLNQLPKLPSHYCRQQTSKVYVEPVFDDNNQIGIYREYLKWCAEHYPQVEPYSIYKFAKVVKQQNIAFQMPKKDQCDECSSFKTGNLSEGDYNAHIERKEAAREEKRKDKERGANGECIVLTQDLQAVKVCPMVNASALYYKTKLCCHNFTVCNINSLHARCYWFTEVDADLSASTFASMVVDYLSDIFVENMPIIIWSDSCGYQNKNAVLANALLAFSVHKNVVIEQKFLEKGHTQMEADSIHATIERKLKNRPIHVPDDYVQLSARARRNPSPYEVKRIDYTFVKNYNVNLVYSSIRPGRQTGDPTVNDIKVIRYTPNGEITVKLDFLEDFRNLPVRKTRGTQLKKLAEFCASRTEPFKIKEQKWTHLQQLKAVIPGDYHHFYDSLPH